MVTKPLDQAVVDIKLDFWQRVNMAAEEEGGITITYSDFKTKDHIEEVARSFAAAMDHTGKFDQFSVEVSGAVETISTRFKATFTIEFIPSPNT